MFAIGTRVTLHGLNAEQYNGKCGEIVIVREDGRRGVRLDGSEYGKAPLALKVANLAAAPLRFSDLTFIVQLLDTSNAARSGHERPAGTIKLEPLGSSARVMNVWRGQFEDAEDVRCDDSAPRLWKSWRDGDAAWYRHVLEKVGSIEHVRLRVAVSRPDGQRVTLFEGDIMDGDWEITDFGDSPPWSLPTILPDLPEAELPARRGLRDVRLAPHMVHASGHVSLEFFTWDDDSDEGLVALREGELEKYMCELLPWGIPDASTRGEVHFPDATLCERVLDPPCLRSEILMAMQHPSAVAAVATVSRAWAATARSVLGCWRQLVYVGHVNGKRRANSKTGKAMTFGTLESVLHVPSARSPSHMVKWQHLKDAVPPMVLAVGSNEGFALGHVHIFGVPATQVAFAATHKNQQPMMEVRELPGSSSGTLSSGWISTLGKTATSEEAHGQSTGPGRPNRLPRPRQRIGELMVPKGMATDGATLWVSDGKMNYARILAFNLLDGSALGQLGGSEERAREIESNPWLGDDGEPLEGCKGLVLVHGTLVACVQAHEQTHLVALSTSAGKHGEPMPIFRSPAQPTMDCIEAGGLAAHSNTIFVADDSAESVHVWTMDIQARTFTFVRSIGAIETVRGIAADACHVYVTAWTFEADSDNSDPAADTKARLEVWTHDGVLRQSLRLEPHLAADETEIVDMGIGLAVGAGHLYVPVQVRSSTTRRFMSKLMVFSLWGRVAETTDADEAAELA